MPFDVAFSLDHGEATAWGIILGEQDGGAWDWANMRWGKADK